MRLQKWEKNPVGHGRTNDTLIPFELRMSKIIRKSRATREVKKTQFLAVLHYVSAIRNGFERAHEVRSKKCALMCAGV